MNERVSAKRRLVVDRRYLRIFRCFSTACWRTSEETLYNGRRFQRIRRRSWPSLFASSSSPYRSWACPTGRRSRRSPNTRHADTIDTQSKLADTKLSWRYTHKPPINGTPRGTFSAPQIRSGVSRDEIDEDGRTPLNFRTTKTILAAKHERQTGDYRGFRTNHCGLFTRKLISADNTYHQSSFPLTRRTDVHTRIDLNFRCANEIFDNKPPTEMFLSR